MWFLNRHVLLQSQIKSSKKYTSFVNVDVNIKGKWVLVPNSVMGKILGMLKQLGYINVSFFSTVNFMESKYSLNIFHENTGSNATSCKKHTWNSCTPFPDSTIVDILPHLPCQSLSPFLFIHACILVGDIMPLHEKCCRI